MLQNILAYTSKILSTYLNAVVLASKETETIKKA
jgi:hypothetical protein